jgi:flagellar basal body rod protein FlgG
MIDAVKAAQLAMDQDQLRLQTLNQNISNMQTPAYKRQLLEMTRFEDFTFQDLSQGNLLQSKNNTDVALSGEGFFTVQNEGGIYYTRRGDWRINEQGQLVMQTGDLILGKAGPLVVDDKTFRIDSQGFVYVDEQKIDQLNVVQFNDSQAIKYLGQGLYESAENPKPLMHPTSVLQGFIEESNVKSIDEMLALMKISRHFEASQRVMHLADSLLSFAINQLGEGNV